MSHGPVDDATASTRTAIDLDTEGWSGPATDVDARPPPRLLPGGARVGRYVVDGAIGRGGMGVVYRAHDPELDRMVALKLLRVNKAVREDGELSRARLLREAQTLARLSHPNVIAVHDAGTFEDDVFLAMELAEGETLAAWVAREHPSRRRVLAAYVAAGRGLAAAHAAGIVHRDFKPKNVIVGNDGRVRVLDFGLAKPIAVPDSDEPLPASSGSPVTDSSSDNLTRAGVIVGTPRYMALEQMTRGPVDERSDQFSFCVALYEALYGDRPYGGQTVKAIARNMRKRQLRPPPRGVRVPRWLRRILVRGLAPDPDARYPSMTAMLDALERTPRRRRRLAGGAILVTAAGVIALVASRTGHGGNPCGDPHALLAGAWDGSRRARVETALAAGDRPHAARTAALVSGELDRYADRWSSLQHQACVATHVRGTASPRLYDLEMQCLGRRRDRLRELTDLLSTTPDGSLLDRAVQSVGELGDLEDCTDQAVLAADVAPPPPARADAVAALRRRIDHSQVLRAAGRYDEALAAIGTAVTDARGLAYPPVLAEALLVDGLVREASGDARGAESAMRQAATAAATAHDDRRAARAWAALLWNLGYTQRKRDQVPIAQLAAEAALARAGDPPVLGADLDNTIGTVRYVAGDYDAARDRFERALAAREKLANPSEVAGVLSNLGLIYYRKGDYARALELHQRALALREKALGPDHPDVATTLNNLGITAERLGRLDDALADYRRAIAIREASLGKGHSSLAGLLNNVGIIFLRRDQPAQAVPYLERALRIKEATFGPDNPRIGTTLDNLAIALDGQGKFAEALPLLQRSLAITEKAMGADHPDAAYTLTTLGDCYLGLGRRRDAVAALERATALRKGHDIPAADLAETQLALARALWPADRARAHKLAAAAERTYAAGGEATRRELAKARAWLADHQRR